MIMLETAEERLPVLLNRASLGVSTAGLAALSVGASGGPAAGQGRSAGDRRPGGGSRRGSRSRA